MLFGLDVRAAMTAFEAICGIVSIGQDCILIKLTTSDQMIACREKLRTWHRYLLGYGELLLNDASGKMLSTQCL